MRLKREQRRWIRRHKGLIVACVITLLMILLVGIYAALLFLNIIEMPDFIKNTIGIENIIKQENTNNNPQTVVEEQTTAAANNNTLQPNMVVLEKPVKEPVIEYKVPENVEIPYYIKVNRLLNCVTIYGIDDNGNYTIPVKAMTCSTGKEGEETPLAISKTSDMYDFHMMVDNTYAQYAYRFNVGGILFHSVPYYTKNKDDLETDQFNKLGDFASLGCVRLCVRDALWIQENCPKGTTVEVYDDPSSVGPLGKPEMIKIPMDSAYKGWDPTDPDENNPWRQCSAKIIGAVDISFMAGQAYNPMSGITAVDTCGNDITDKIIVYGAYDTNTAGTYQLTYSVTDLIGSYDEVTININVVQ